MSGFGDARHIYSSLIDLHQQVELLSNDEKNKVQVSFVLNDIKPHPLAKLLIMINAFDKLANFEYDQIGSEYEATKAAALCVYLFVGHIMPFYLEQEVFKIINDLLTLQNISSRWSYLKINENSWQNVKIVLREWATTAPLTTSEIISLYTAGGNLDMNSNMGLSNDYKQKVEAVANEIKV